MSLERAAAPDLWVREYKGPVDVIAAEHQAIHSDLERWGLWCRERKGAGGGGLGSMERLYRSRMPSATGQADDQRSAAIERALIGVPDQHRETLRMFYVKRASPHCICRVMKLRADVFPVWMRTARAMVLALLP